MKKPLFLAATALVFATVGHAQVAIYNQHVDPRATFYQTFNDALAVDTVPLNLASLGLRSGDQLGFLRIGRFSYKTGEPDSTATLHGVFSASDVLLPANQQYRVADAIDAGVDIVTIPTFFGAQETDIPEDFLISGFNPPGPSGVVVTIPSGATHLFVAAFDSFYTDNTDPNGDFQYFLSAHRPIAIDVKPGAADNAFNARSQFATVAILNAPNMDFSELILSNIRFAGASIRTKPNGAYHVEFLDVNADLLPDLVLHFNLGDLVLAPGQTTAELTGLLTTNITFSGSDTIQIK